MVETTHPAPAAFPPKPAWRGLVAPVLLLAALALVPTLSQVFDNPFLIRLFTRVIILSIAAVALNFVLGFGGLVSLMHAGLFGIGAYTVAILSFHDFNAQPLLGWTGTSDLALSGPLAVIAAATAAALAGLVCLRTTGTYFIMITLAFNQMLYYFFVALQEYGGDDGLQILGTIDFAGMNVTKRVTFYYICLATLAVVIALFARVVGSRFGTILRATAQNERRAIALGIAPLRYKLAAFALSGAVTGLAGALWATGQGFVSPADMAWTRSGDLIVMAVLGGLASVWAPVIGAVLFLVLQSFLSGWTVFWQLPLGLVIIFTIVLLRGGLVDLLDRLRATLTGGKR